MTAQSSEGRGSGPTLLDDLEMMAQVLDGLLAQHRAKGNLDGVTECDFQAARLRAHATRLRGEMDKARGKLNESIRAKSPDACAAWIIVGKALETVRDCTARADCGGCEDCRNTALGALAAINALVPGGT